MRRRLPLLAALLTVAAVVAGVGMAASVVPTIIPGPNNDGKTCAEAFPGTIELRSASNPSSGSFTDGTLTVTIVRPSATNPAKVNSFDFVASFKVVGVVVKDGVDGANKYDYLPAGIKSDTYLTTPFDGDKGISHINFCYRESDIPTVDNPSVSKDAAGSYDDTFAWDIAKSADKETVYSVGGAESGAVNYTVSVTHSGPTRSNVKVTGTITATNPNDGSITLADVTDVLSNSTGCTVDKSNGLTVPANGTKDYPYSCDLGSSVPEGDLTNKATISWSDQVVDGADLAAGSTDFTTGTIDFTGTEVDECVTVNDTNPNGPQNQEVCADDPSPTEFKYSATFTDPAGTCTKHENTASSVTNDSATKDEAKATVQDCQGANLTVEKTATPSFTRDYDWKIDKVADKDTVYSAGGGESGAVNYTVTVSHDAGTDSGWLVKGTIKVSNPNDWQDITLTDLSDAIDNGGACTLDSAGPYVVAKSSSLSVDYTCTYAAKPDPAAFLNEATAKWDAAAAHTPSGSALGQAKGAFGDPTSLVDECIDVKDDNGTPANTADDKVLGKVCVGGANPTEFKYSKTLDPGDAKCITYTNTASYTTTDDNNDTDEAGSDSETVTYCVPATIGYWKTHIRACVGKEKTGTNGCSNNGPFTVQFLPVSLGNYVVDTGAKALAVFDANNCSNAATSDNNAAACLAAQLLGAKLNVKNNSPSCINATIALADAFLINNVSPAYNGPTGGPYTLNTRAQAIALKDKLDNYNKGLGC